MRFFENRTTFNLAQNFLYFPPSRGNFEICKKIIEDGEGILKNIIIEKFKAMDKSTYYGAFVREIFYIYHAAPKLLSHAQAYRKVQLIMT